MLIINFHHPLTSEQLAQIEALTGQPVAKVRDVPTQFDHEKPFGPQVTTLADQAGLSSTEWQTAPILIVPPALNFVAALLLAELHGRDRSHRPLLSAVVAEACIALPALRAAELVDGVDEAPVMRPGLKPDPGAAGHYGRPHIRTLDRSGDFAWGGPALPFVVACEHIVAAARAVIVAGRRIVRVKASRKTRVVQNHAVLRGCSG